MTGSLNLRLWNRTIHLVPKGVRMLERKLCTFITASVIEYADG